jgi:hypothetical protein
MRHLGAFLLRNRRVVIPFWILVGVGVFLPAGLAIFGDGSSQEAVFSMLAALSFGIVSLLLAVAVRKAAIRARQDAADPEDQ